MGYNYTHKDQSFNYVIINGKTFDLGKNESE